MHSLKIILFVCLLVAPTVFSKRRGRSRMRNEEADLMAGSRSVSVNRHRRRFSSSSDLGNPNVDDLGEDYTTNNHRSLRGRLLESTNVKVDTESKALSDVLPTEKVYEKLCVSHDGRKFQEGAEWHNGDCTFCECVKGKVLCSIEDCQIPHCPNPEKIPGHCCPVCLDTSCYATNGTRIPAGEVWKEGICTHCYCAGGEKKCAEEKCPYINCTDAYRPEGKCCAKCQTNVVDCVASTWGQWNKCPTQECGGGMRRRFRSIVIHQRNGGNFCPYTSEAQICPKLPCDELPFCPVSEWTDWGGCSVTCGNGERLRFRKMATKKATMLFLMDCSTTHMQEAKSCYAGSCAAHSNEDNRHEAPLYDDICYDVRWTDWEECSEKCGSGIQRRHQVLLNESHPRGHLCHLLDETRACQGIQCENDGRTDQKCVVTNWSEWSKCPSLCGQRSRRTRNRTVVRNGGGHCPHLVAHKTCKTKPCRNHSSSRSRSNQKETRCFAEDGKAYSSGDIWSPSSCTSCFCIQGKSACYRRNC